MYVHYACASTVYSLPLTLIEQVGSHSIDWILKHLMKLLAKTLPNILVIQQLLSSSSFPSPMQSLSLHPVWALLLFSTCQKRKHNFRSGFLFFIPWHRNHRSGLLMSFVTEVMHMSSHVVSKAPLSVLIEMQKGTMWRGNEASKQWFHTVCNFLVLI